MKGGSTLKGPPSLPTEPRVIPYRFPVTDQVPRVSLLVLFVVQVVGFDAVLCALGEVLVDVASDASLGEADAQGTNGREVHVQRFEKRKIDG